MKPTPWDKWLKANGHKLAMCTGQDYAALGAIAAVWELLTQDGDARRGAVDAALALLPAMQRKCWPLARELVAKSMDWGDRAKVWALMRERLAQRIDEASALADAHPDVEMLYPYQRLQALFDHLAEMPEVSPR